MSSPERHRTTSTSSATAYHRISDHGGRSSGPNPRWTACNQRPTVFSSKAILAAPTTANTECQPSDFVGLTGASATISTRPGNRRDPSPTLAANHGPSRRQTTNEELALHVLFVCTGNICRSPTAERFAAAYGARFQIPDFRTSSAGTRAVIAHPIQRDAALVLETLGGDASNFAARQLTSRIASDADLVLTMTRAHRDTVLELAPRQLHRTFTLSEAAQLASEPSARNVADFATLRPQLTARELSDIPDPIGQSTEFFAMVGSKIADLLPPILELCRP